MGQTAIRTILSISMVLYFSAFILFLLKNEKSTKRFTLIAYSVWGMGMAADMIVVISNFITNGYVPFVGTFQVLVFLSFLFPVVYHYIRFMYKGTDWMAPYFCLASSICLVGVLVMGYIRQARPLPPALQSVWFVPHILTYMISYSLFGVAFLIVVGGLFDKRYKERIDRGVYGLVCTGFPFVTMGMFFGAIWANDAWGQFWSWDGKENWSLVMWVLYLLYLHFYKNEDLKKYANFVSVLGFVALIITMFFVQFFHPASVHVYS